jgi:hypothetical protein
MGESVGVGKGLGVGEEVGLGVDEGVEVGVGLGVGEGVLDVGVGLDAGEGVLDPPSVPAGSLLGKFMLDKTYATRNNSKQAHTRTKINILLPIFQFH